MEEYRQLYSLALYRLQVLDQRIPLATAALTAVLGSVVVVPEVLQLGLLVALPIASALLYLSTVNHVRSLEDVLSRIAEIELDVNQICGTPILRFQNTHPSRGIVGARTGRVTADLVLIVSLMLSAGAIGMAEHFFHLSPGTRIAQAALVVALGAFSLYERNRLQKYRYWPSL